MLRRLVFLLAALASLSIGAAPAIGASTYHIREEGSALSAYFTNIPEGAFEEDGTLPAGSYVETYVDAANLLSSGPAEHGFGGVCVWHWEFSIDENGEWLDGTGVFACGEVDSLTIDGRLTTGHVAASFPVEDCLAWDEQTGECIEPVVLGELAIDLTLTADGRAIRYHGTSTGGTAGSSQYVFHGTGSYRAATPAGTVTLDGASLLDGTTSASGSLVQSKTGWVEVYHENR